MKIEKEEDFIQNYDNKDLDNDPYISFNFTDSLEFSLNFGHIKLEEAINL